MSQIFRSFEANSWTIKRKGSEDLAKSSTPAVDHSYLGQAPTQKNVTNPYKGSQENENGGQCLSRSGTKSLARPSKDTSTTDELGVTSKFNSTTNAP